MACISVKNKIISRSMLVGNSAYIPTISVDILVIAGGGGASAYDGTNTNGSNSNITGGALSLTAAVGGGGHNVNGAGRSEIGRAHV